MVRALLAAWLAAALAGCAAQRPRHAQAAHRGQGQTTQTTTTHARSRAHRPARPPAAAGHAAVNPAVAALLRRARHEERAGHANRSEAILERALHIQPRDALIWYRIARLRLAQHQPAQAESFAVKSAGLARADRTMAARAWALVAETRRAQGHARAAGLARARAAALREQP